MHFSSVRKWKWPIQSSNIGQRDSENPHSHCELHMWSLWKNDFSYTSVLPLYFILPIHIFVVLKTSKTHETKILLTCDLLFGMRIPLATLALNHCHRKQLQMRKVTKNNTEKGTTLPSIVLAVGTADSSHTSWLIRIVTTFLCSGNLLLLGPLSE